MNKCKGHDIAAETAHFIEVLRQHGSRVTQQRKSLIKAILNFRKPFSADDLAKKVSRSGIDLATIYRSLQSFTEMEILTTVDFSDGLIRYEYLSSTGHHHHHIICTQCKSVEPLDFCVVKGQEKLIKEMGYQNITHKLEFFGTCKSCSKALS